MRIGLRLNAVLQRVLPFSHRLPPSARGHLLSLVAGRFRRV